MEMTEVMDVYCNSEFTMKPIVHIQMGFMYLVLLHLVPDWMRCHLAFSIRESLCLSSAVRSGLIENG